MVDHQIDTTAALIRSMPDDARRVILDALRVRAMDFVDDRLGGRGGGYADAAADIHRRFIADSAGPFEPDTYRSFGPYEYRGRPATR